MAERALPRYLDSQQASRLRDRIAAAVSRVRAELIADGADPSGLDHEIGIMLARAACRFAMDPLEVAATTTIGRLEVLVAELGARLERSRITAAPNRPRYVDVVEIAPAPAMPSLSRDALMARAENGTAPHPLTCSCSTCRA